MHTPYTPESYTDLRAAIRELCSNFPNAYWRALDKTRQYPEAFVQHLTASGYLAALIPKEYGGLGLSMYQEVRVVYELGYAAPAFRAYFGTSCPGSAPMRQFRLNG